MSVHFNTNSRDSSHGATLQQFRQVLVFFSTTFCFKLSFPIIFIRRDIWPFVWTLWIDPFFFLRWWFYAGSYSSRRFCQWKLEEFRGQGIDTSGISNRHWQWFFSRTNLSKMWAQLIKHNKTSWWFQIFFIFRPYLGNWSNLNVFQSRWFNHQRLVGVF